MKALLTLSRGIDLFNEKVGVIAVWAVFISCLVSAGNAVSRYLLSISSNAWLELQWYLFAATVMLGASYVLKLNEHVRVDVVYGRLSGRAKAVIDLLGLIFFMMPAVTLVLWMSWPWALESWANQETSLNAGGLIRWPAKFSIPLGFAMLTLQGVSEIIKRVAFLRGVITMDTHYERPLQ
jgi:TRAP-type mannitol/chloroaromatic compound transport system permease small subunit